MTTAHPGHVRLSRGLTGVADAGWHVHAASDAGDDAFARVKEVGLPDDGTVMPIPDQQSAFLEGSLGVLVAPRIRMSRALLSLVISLPMAAALVVSPGAFAASRTIAARVATPPAMVLGAELASPENVQTTMTLLADATDASASLTPEASLVVLAAFASLAITIPYLTFQVFRAVAPLVLQFGIFVAAFEYLHIVVPF